MFLPKAKRNTFLLLRGFEKPLPWIWESTGTEESTGTLCVGVFVRVVTPNHPTWFLKTK